MLKQKQLIAELLAVAGVTIDGGQPWDIQVRDKRLYTRVLRGKNLGLGEAFLRNTVLRNLPYGAEKTIWSKVKKQLQESWKLKTIY